jgi:Transposase.
MCHKKQSADIYEQWGRSIKLVNGSHTISMIDKFPSKSHLWNTASTPRKKVISVPNCDWWQKVDLFGKPKVEKIVAVPSEASPSTPRPNCFGRKIMLCVWWDQSSSVYYKPLEPGETVNAQRYHQEMINLNHALIKKQPEWAKRHGKGICYTTMPRLTHQY